METHKIQNKQSLQKSKGIRAKLQKALANDKHYNSFKFSLDFGTLCVRRFGNGSFSFSVCFSLSFNLQFPFVGALQKVLTTRSA